MPFKIFRTHKKDKKGQLKARSKSTIDLSAKEEPPDQPQDDVFVSPTKLQLRSKSSLHLGPVNGSSLHLFAPSKASNRFSIKEEKEEKVEKRKKRISVHVMETQGMDFSSAPVPIIGRNSHLFTDPVSKSHPLAEQINTKNHVTFDHNSKNHLGGEQISKNHIDHNGRSQHHLNNHHHHHHQQQQQHSLHHLQVPHYSSGDHGELPSKSASCGSFMDSYSRERRLCDIAQLDSYINYLRRTAEDGINTASRMCCAQVLRLSFMRLEKRYVSDVLHSSSHQDKMDSYYATPSHLSLSPPQTSHFERRMTSFRRRPPYLPNLKARHPEWNHSGEDAEDERRDGRLLDGSEDDDQSPTSPTDTGSSGPLEGKEKGSDYGSDYDSDSGCSSQPPAVARRKSVPVFPADIDIY